MGTLTNSRSYEQILKIVGTLTNSRSYRQTLKLWELLQIGFKNLE
ncbi:hypothetical protein LEP1GSC034_4538 [Leptospira interrogans str. 2003000735]|uniref:Uncharacterized protein n=2 Tax=Leptospira interrogans TaxID=173 RepID=A0A829D340_LEPIR|nr:hypothetical protein LEP1GSC027_0303 [Leptospira interrogans str. 2002000624]EKQ40049.1 hypothetical protein LEP1GSC025_2042 [Leptospira interrogans str. 2002000621]EKQ48055.1 hypothetical protein LEP1GSC026_2006 [Leptospira interrogans str. 2002000623]EMJ53681.1 hypothetical protein LEP1GSC013_1787 [Leptospira interrogans serovar Valbuzzi str. Duyster]EMJ71361.1 hypothetical protein LEP1GSC034_4538 [Leptospira interrogans str. 2003000735]EMY02546.1 hypothetical protein LEP1GSC029_1641 [Lep